MLWNMLRQANPVRVQNLLFTLAVVCLALFVSACVQANTNKARQTTAEQAWSVELREAEHKTVMHPEKRFYANIWPSGLQVNFNTAQGHFGTYEFPHEAFPLGESAFLSCPGSPDILPMRVVRLNENEANYHYKIEWLAKSPATSDGVRKIVRSH